jgi:murein DD-endopeptidase MepM/ murein hydrolase activator NlpD
MGALGTGAGVQAQQASDAPRIERTGGEAVGASIAHPAGWRVEREPYTYDDTYGFTLWRPGSGAEREHWGTPAVRVALAYDLDPEQIEAAIRERLAAYPDLPMERQTVSVADKGYEGVAIGPIPGSTPSAEVYVPVNGRVYQINVYGEELVADGTELLSALRFKPPSRSISSLGLPDANAPEALYASTNPELAERERAAREAVAEKAPEASFEASALTQPGEKRIEEGCWRAHDSFYVQTQHGRYANRRSGDGIPTGYALVGHPNYWDEYTHGDLGSGYGRCNEPFNTNDKFAVDYRLDRGDYVFSPVERGRVTFAGRNTTHKDYGILVVIKAANRKYVSLSGHLNALRRGLDKGDRVSRKTVIGYAGDSGGPTFPVGPVHLHQAFYRYPSYNPDGSPYGGAGLQVVRHHYVRGDGGVYRFGWTAKPGIKSKGSLIKN